MAFNLRTHERDNLGRETTRPYMRVMVQGFPPVFVQGGKFYSEGGQEYDPLPPGILNELQKCHPGALAEVGLDPDDPSQPLPAPRQERVRLTRPRVRQAEEELIDDEPDPADDAGTGNVDAETAAAEAEAAKAPVRTTKRKSAA